MVLLVVDGVVIDLETNKVTLGQTSADGEKGSHLKQHSTSLLKLSSRELPRVGKLGLHKLPPVNFGKLVFFFNKNKKNLSFYYSALAAATRDG
jgi:hypothetical protein